MSKLAQRNMFSGNHRIDVSLIGNIGSISITDNGLYPDNDSRSVRRNMNFNTLTVPLMTRKQLKDLKIAIEEVLKHSK